MSFVVGRQIPWCNVECHSTVKLSNVSEQYQRIARRRAYVRACDWLCGRQSGRFQSIPNRNYFAPSITELSTFDTLRRRTARRRKAGPRIFTRKTALHTNNSGAHLNGRKFAPLRQTVGNNLLPTLTTAWLIRQHS